MMLMSTRRRLSVCILPQSSRCPPVFNWASALPSRNLDRFADCNGAAWWTIFMDVRQSKLENLRAEAHYDICLPTYIQVSDQIS